ncbi:MAG: hypothetical protein QOG06_1091 [Gaiellaceae bacterium]|nr:hypothetical protein [Gaiellaceae bacterium]
MQWYDTVKRAPDASQPITLSDADVARATQAGADAAGATLVAAHYVPLLGGAADVVVQPDHPVPFAEHAGQKLVTLLGPLARDGRAYLVTVVDSTQAPLLVLGWNPGVAQAGEGSRGKRRASARARSSGSSSPSQVTDCYKDRRAWPFRRFPLDHGPQLGFGSSK